MTKYEQFQTKCCVKIAVTLSHICFDKTATMAQPIFGHGIREENLHIEFKITDLNVKVYLTNEIICNILKIATTIQMR